MGSPNRRRRILRSTRRRCAAASAGAPSDTAGRAYRETSPPTLARAPCSRAPERSSRRPPAPASGAPSPSAPSQPSHPTYRSPPRWRHTYLPSPSVHSFRNLQRSAAIVARWNDRLAQLLLEANLRRVVAHQGQPLHLVEEVHWHSLGLFGFLHVRQRGSLCALQCSRAFGGLLLLHKLHRGSVHLLHQFQLLLWL